MYKIAVVILNYLNYKDTIECVESMLKMDYPICGAVIVDNASRNGSYEILKRKYENNNQIQVVANSRNQGYARGNNLGIKYARNKWKAEFVLIVNNDTVFIDEHYITELIRNYQTGVGVIGSKIILNKECEAPPFLYYFEFKDLFANYFNMLSRHLGSCFDFPQNQGKPEKILHGCALMLTPDFFQKYQGFFKFTFLYGEEAILFLMCKCHQLRQVYVPDARIYHKEDQSSFMSFQNEKVVLNKYGLQSMKFIILYKIKYSILTKVRKRKRKREHSYDRKRISFERF